MKATLFKIILTLFCLTALRIHSAISIVYNIRIAESTKRSAFEKSSTPSSLSILGFNTNRKKRTTIHHNAGGLLATFSYVMPSFFARTDFAFGKVKETQKISFTQEKKFSRIQTDDLLFSAGYSLTIKKNTKLTISGLLGIPTHNDTRFEALQFGTGHIGIGVQTDGAFLYHSPKKHTIRTAARYIYYVPRKTRTNINDKVNYYDFNLGNIIDLFIAHHLTFKKHNFEYGYDQTFIFGSKIYPHLKDAVTKTNIIRSSFYTTYKYRFALKKVPNAVAMAVSYAFDSRPKKFGNKRIITTWASWSVSF